jgi:hypothetical protein
MPQQEQITDIVISLLFLLEDLKGHSSTYTKLKDDDDVTVMLRVGTLKEAERTLEKIKEFIK